MDTITKLVTGVMGLMSALACTNGCANLLGIDAPFVVDDAGTNDGLTVGEDSSSSSGGSSSLAIDPNTPTMAQANSSNAFSPPAGSGLLIVTAGTLSASTGNQDPVVSITDSLGSHLVYTRLVADDEGYGNAEFWWANCPTAQTGMTVTVHWAMTPNDVVTGVVVFTNAAGVQNGATATAQGQSLSIPNMSITTTGDGSWVIGCVENWFNNDTPTIPNGQTDSFNGNVYSVNTTGSSQWAQRTATTTPASGTSVTINDTTPTAPKSLAMVLVEVRAGGH